MLAKEVIHNHLKEYDAPITSDTQPSLVTTSLLLVMLPVNIADKLKGNIIRFVLYWTIWNIIIAKNGNISWKEILFEDKPLCYYKWCQNRRVKFIATNEIIFIAKKHIAGPIKYS